MRKKESTKMKVYNDEYHGDVSYWVPTEDVIEGLVNLSNDIDQYLQSDAPLECHNKDIGRKIQTLIDVVKQQVAEQTGDTSPQQKGPYEHRKGGSRP